MTEIEKGFIAYSAGKATVPPVGELILSDPPGEAHIKYGYVHDGPYYVIKIASGFYQNAAVGLPSSNGMMLVFDRRNGMPVATLLDEGHLTDVRTAVAGAIAAKYLAADEISRIGIVGTGAQARLQLEYLKPVTDCRDVLIWGRDEGKAKQCGDDVEKIGFNASTTDEPRDILQHCNLIVTTTASTTPILSDVDSLQSGTHITAMGSDTEDKQELSAVLLGRADVVVADSIAQCLLRGEIHQALAAGTLDQENLQELGAVIAGSNTGRENSQQVTVADLTGVAVQDIQIATAVVGDRPDN